jgi:hypothetical protein
MPVNLGSFDQIISSVQRSLTPDLLRPEYRGRNATNPMFGHCYVATEAFYHLTKEECPGRFSIYHGKDDDGIVHWWLHDNYEIRIVDLTADQYLSLNRKPPYEKGRAGFFLTKNPSKRAVIVMEKVMNELRHVIS